MQDVHVRIIHYLKGITMSKTEILTVRISPRKEGETRAGWVEGMSTEEAWEAGHRDWVLKSERAFACDQVLVLAPDHTIIAVSHMEGLRKVDGGRFAIIGKPEPHHEWLGRTVQRSYSQNPVAYIKEDTIR